MTRTKSSRALLSVVLAVLMVAAFMPALTYSSFAATAKKATKVTKLTHTGAKVYGKVGNKYVLKYKLSPSKLTSAAKKTVWKSSDSSIVKVYSTKSNRAAVKAKAEGTAKVTVYTKANKKAKATWTFKVTKKADEKTELTAVTVSAPNAKDPATELNIDTELQAKVNPSDAKNVTYQWYADGTAIEGATSANFTVTTDQIGKAITVKATSKNDVTSAATAKVSAVKVTGIDLQVNNTNADTKAANPYVSASTVDKIGVGRTLKATLKNDNAEANSAAASYQWYRVTTATSQNTIETPISGATSQTYTLTKDDLGSAIKVVVTPKSNVTATNVVNGTYTATLAQAKVDGGLTVAIQANGKDVKTAALNTALTAVVTPSDAAVTYQWYKDGVRIADATSATYTPTAKGTYTVKATVAATEKTYTKGEYTSGKVVVGGDTISKAELKDNQVTTTRTDIVRGDTLAVSAQVMGKTLVNGTDYTVEWYKNGTKISGQTADTLKINDAKVGDVYKAVVTGKGTYGGDPVESNSLTVTKLGDVSDIVTATNVRVERTGNVITISGLPVTDVTPGQDYTVDIVKYTTATDSTVSKKTVATIKTVDNEGKATYELSTDDLKVATGESAAFKVVINGAGNYTGSIAPVTVPEPAEK